MTDNKTILEILVDKTNEKGAGAFEHILIVLHKILEKKPSFFDKKEYIRPSFSFEIVKIGNRIRFFLISDKKYKNFLKNQIFAHYNDVEINELSDYLEPIPNDKIFVGKIKQEEHYYYSIKNFTDLQESSANVTIDPYSSITSALSKTGNSSMNVFQVNYSPIRDKEWKGNSKNIIRIITGKFPDFLKEFLLKPNPLWLNILLYPFILLSKIFKVFIPKGEGDDEGEKDNKSGEQFDAKLSGYGYGTTLNIICATDDEIEAKMNIKDVVSTLGIYSIPGQNGFKLAGISRLDEDIEIVKNRQSNDDFVLNTSELSGLVHLPTTYVKTPTINWVISRNFEPPGDLPIIDHDLDDDIEETSDNLTPIGKTNFRGTNISFGMGPDDRRRHVYIIGKTGMGKSVLLENMIIDDIKKGRGVAVVDPHGDLAEQVIGFIPKSRTNQTIIFDPSDTESPIAFNMLENVPVNMRPLVASGLVGIFKKIFGDSWGPRLEHILRNTILALLEYPNSTLISIPMMLTSEVYRNKVVNKITDPVVKNFWKGEFAKMEPKAKVEAAGPILNKVGQFLSSTILRNILGQSKNSFSVRWAMDNQKIIIVNLSKGKIGEDASTLLGAMMVTKFQMDAMARADMPESERKDFYLYVDEFQNFATDSFATILSEARKYKLNLVMANQYIDQMQETVKGAVFGNVGTTVSFQVGYHDSTTLNEVLGSGVTSNDLTNLKKYTIYLKQLINGMPSPIFSANTFPPHSTNPEAFSARYKKILQVSREKYATPRKTVEYRINKELSDIDKQEGEWGKKKEAYAQKIKEEKAKKHNALLEKQAEEKAKREKEEALKQS